MKRFVFTLVEGCATHLVTTMHKTAFTLAEVLITLAIIGIVAALTIPTLIKNYQMKSFEVAFKKEYATVQNVINYLGATENTFSCSFDGYNTIEDSNGNIINTSYKAETSGCQKLKENLISQLKLSEISDDYYLDYATTNDILNNGGKAINSSYSYEYFVRWAKAYMLPDGAIILIFNKEDNTIYNINLVIDVNGAKGPNKWGYDVFFFTLTKHPSANNLILSDQYASIIEEGGKLPRTILRNQKDNTSFKYEW